MKCPKCKEEVIKDNVGNYSIKFMGLLMSHNISCDNKYLEKE